MINAEGLPKASMVLFTVLFSFSYPLWACSPDGLLGIVPANDLWIPEMGFLANTEMDQVVFNQVIDEVESVFAPIFSRMGKPLKINRLWENGTVNAEALVDKNFSVVNMFGGLARHPKITADAFALVLCHELGHHLGGAPKKISSSSQWASNEGQSDYWAAMKCFRRVYEQTDNSGFIAKMDVPGHVQKTCLAATEQSEDFYGYLAPEALNYELCVRTAMAGQSLALFFQDFRKLSKVPEFHTPDPMKVATTNHGHPEAQCRLDTYFQGALCDEDWGSEISNTDPNKGFCNSTRGDKLGIRPLCWFRP